MLNESNALERVIDRKIANAVGRRTRTSGTVSRIETDGTVYVLFDGATDDTLVAKTTATVKPGDLVTVRVENGVATIEGNVSDPAASSVRLSATHETAAAALGNAQKASEAATSAQASADSAASAAASAQGSANDAATAASSAQDSADDAARAASVADGKAVAAGQAAETAQRSANQASAHATNALNQLGIVQDVVGVLDYAARHGSFARTSDTAVQAGKVYFTYDSQSGDYAPVIDPQESALPTYYELTYSDDTMGDFIMSHLAVTQRGLWVLPSGMGQASDEQYAPGYKMLLSSGGSYIYDANGALVRSDTASGTDFSAGRRWHVGGDDAYILYTPASGSTPASLTIGGSNIELGDSRTLSQLIAEVDGTLIFKVTETYFDDETTATLTAHVYKGGVDTASSYPDSCFAWYRKSEHGTTQDTAAPEVPIGNGRTITVSRSAVGFGAAIKCNFTPPNDSVLLDEDDDTLTDSEGTPIAGRTPSGNYVRVADLTATTTVFDTDKLMLVGSEEEQLVSIATLKDVFGDGDYERLDNKPSIEGVELSGDKAFNELGIFQTDSQGYDVPDDYTLSTLDINALWANAQPIGG